MDIVTTEREGVTIFAVKGRLDGSHAAEAEAAFLAIANQGASRFVFDFTEMQYISSAGLRVVLVAAKKIRALQGRMVCAGMSEQVTEVFEMSGFLSILEAVVTVEEAVSRLRTA